MWNADVTSSQRSPGLNATSSLVKAAFSAVLRERFSNATRARGMPKISASGGTKLASGAMLARNEPSPAL